MVCRGALPVGRVADLTVQHSSNGVCHSADTALPLGWINNQTGYYGPDQITYQVNWLKCARDYHSIDVDYLGLWK